MKLFRILLLALTLSSASQQLAASQVAEQAAVDKASLGAKIARLLESTHPDGAQLQGALELILRVGANGKIEVLDIAGDEMRSVVFARFRIETAQFSVDDALEGRSFRYHFEPGEPLT